jgi:hypothetical protein
MTVLMKCLAAEKGDWGAKSVLTMIAILAIACRRRTRNTRPHSLRDVLLGHRGVSASRRAPPPVARYVSETGSAFILDRASSLPLMKFDNSPEVWVLSAQPASRGDVIYRNEMGEPVLRATKLGGMILFTDDAPWRRGRPQRPGASMQPPAVLSVNVLFQRLTRPADPRQPRGPAADRVRDRPGRPARDLGPDRRHRDLTAEALRAHGSQGRSLARSPRSRGCCWPKGASRRDLEERRADRHLRARPGRGGSAVVQTDHQGDQP